MPSELTIFDDARAIADPAARAAFLDRACGAEADLRRRVEELLAAAAAAAKAGFLDPPAEVLTGTYDLPDSDATLPPPPAATSGQRPAAGGMVGGRYKLLEPVGEGGMGAVWMARQVEPVVRLVAVKLIKPGMDSKAVLARFEQERQALALMDHPNIARVFDAGTAADGRPFFVMEFVKGLPITDFCDERRLPIPARLALFAQVCRAVQHAHQKGVIHRDIKPSNVLVGLYDDEPVPKVIDFGVAKATGEPLTAQTLFTGLGAVVGTPAYMAPEQATLNNLDVDTRADVYGLGALLYELLAGSPPFLRGELQQRGLLEMLRVVREEEPPRPSARVSTADGRPSIAAVRGTEPGALGKLLRSDLDWVVMKALEKDRGRRYETAAGFAADVGRYLAGEAVLAHPPGVGYRVRKFARRNRLALSAVAVAVAGAGATAAGLVAVERERAGAAEREAARARVLTGKLQDLLAAASPVDGGGPEMSVRDLLDAQAPKLFDGLDDQPGVEAELRATVGKTYATLIEPIQAAAHYERAADLRRTRLPPDFAGLGGVLISLADVYLNDPHDRPVNLADKRVRTGRAVATAREAVGLLRQAGTPAALIDALAIYGSALARQAELGNATPAPGEDLHRQMLDAVGRLPVGPERDRAAAWAEVFRLENLGRRGDAAAATQAIRVALPLWAAQYGENHLYTLRARLALGIRLMEDRHRDYLAAEGQIRRAIDGYRVIFKGKTNPYEANAARCLVQSLAWQYKDADVDALFKKYPAEMRDQRGVDVWAARVPYQRGAICAERGDYAEAARHQRDALAAARKYNSTDGLQADARVTLIDSLMFANKFEEGVDEVEPLLPAARRATADNLAFRDLRTFDDFLKLRVSADKLCIGGFRYRGDAVAAKRLSQEGLDRLPADSPRRVNYHTVGIYADFILGNYEPALSDLPAILDTVPPWHLHARRTIERVLVDALDRTGRPDEAVAVRRRGVEHAERELPKGHPETSARRVLLADALAKLTPRKPSEELEQLQRAWDDYTTHPEAKGSLLGRRADVADRFLEAYIRFKDIKKVDQWKKRTQSEFPAGVTRFPRQLPFPVPAR